MTDRLTEAREREIRGRLGAITPGPWTAREMTHFGQGGTGFGYVVCEGGEKSGRYRAGKALFGHGESDSGFWEDAVFVSHAPEDVRVLLGEVERLRIIAEGAEKNVKLLMAGMESQAELMDGLKQKARKAEAEVQRLRSLLAAIADPPKSLDREAALEHCRDVARGALEGKDVEGKPDA